MLTSNFVPRCAYEKIQEGIVGTVACSVGSCAVTLFVRALGEEPVNTSIYFSCGQPVYPADSMEWRQVEVRHDSRITASGQELVRISYRDELCPVIE
jgi:hypothetical protein